jgi:hypothetical protein
MRSNPESRAAMTYPLSAVRTLALHVQGLTTPNGAEPEPTTANVDALARNLAFVQIDTLHVVQRAQYLTLWSRFGDYDPSAWDTLSYDAAERRWFEGWFHALCYLPLEDYRYRIPRMRRWREEPSDHTLTFLKDNGGDILDRVLGRIRDEGPLRTADFDGDGRKRGSWWDWKPAKYALEILFHRGELMITNRVNFHRVYDLAERVLPDWVDTTEPTGDEVMRYLVERMVKSAGAAQPSEIMGRMMGRKRDMLAMTGTLLAEGVLTTVEAALADGEAHTLLIHRDNLPLLQQAADSAIQPRRTTFINFFDNLFWEYKRDAHLWNYNHLLEAYVPGPKRLYGYFCMDILHRDRFIGRFDPKVDRKRKTMILKALYLEPGVTLDDAMLADVAAAMGDFMAFHGADDLVVESSKPAAFGKKLLKLVNPKPSKKRKAKG